MLYIFLILRALALSLPLKISYFIVDVLTAIKYFFWKKDREAVLYNLEPIITDLTVRKKAARKVFANFGYYLVDFLRYSKIDEKFIERYVKVEGLDFYRDAVSANNGVIVSSAHLGNYELGGAVCASLGDGFSAVALAHKNKRVNDFFNNQRMKVGIKIIPTGIALRRCYGLLRDGGVLGMIGDRVFVGEGIETELLRRRCLLPKGLAFLSIKTLSPVVPSFFVRENKYHYKLIFEKPIYPSADKDASAILDEYALVLSKYLRKYPEQWYIFQKHWL